MRKVLRALAGGLCLLAMLPGGLGATTAVALNPEEMARQAQVIVAGRCLHVESAWLGSDLVTLATFAVADGLKGEKAGTEITVVLPGGVDMNRRFPVAMTYPGAPELGEQEQALLFLTPEARVDNGFTVVGYSQGKFTLVAGADGKKLATQDLGGLSLQGRAGAVTRGSSRAVPYEQLRRQILDAVSGEKAGRKVEP